MVRTLAPYLSESPSQRELVAVIRRLAQDLYELKGGFSAAPPLQVAENSGGVQLSMNTAALPFTQFIKPTTATSSAVILPGGRQVSDGVENGTTTLTSATANFTSADVGKELVGANIPVGTKVSVVNSSSNITMSAAATTSASSVTVTIGGIVGYSAKNDRFNLTSGFFDDLLSVWFLPPNNEVPAANTRYLSKLVGVDNGGVPIWAAQQFETAFTPDEGTAKRSSNVAIGTSYADVLHVTVANSGLYWISAFVSGEGEYTGVLGTNTCAVAILSNTTSGGISMPGVVFLAPQQSTGNPFYGSASLSTVAVVNAGDVIALEVEMANASVANWTIANVMGGTSGLPGTYMSFVQIG